MDPSTATVITTGVEALTTAAAALSSSAGLPQAVGEAVAAQPPTDFAKNVYIFCTVAGLAWLIISGLIGPLIGDITHHGGLDGAGGHGEVHFSPFSPAVISAFVAMFGCGGLLAMGTLGYTSIQALPIAMAGGFAGGGVVFWMLRYVATHMQESIEIPASSLIGLEAEVVTSVPAGGVGQIAYNTPAGRQTASARTEDGSPVRANTIVEIIGTSGSHKIIRRKESRPAGAGPVASETAPS